MMTIFFVKIIYFVLITKTKRRKLPWFLRWFFLLNFVRYFYVDFAIKLKWTRKKMIYQLWHRFFLLLDNNCEHCFLSFCLLNERRIQLGFLSHIFFHIFSTVFECLLLFPFVFVLLIFDFFFSEINIWWNIWVKRINTFPIWIAILVLFFL